jgi:hypothetical protein
MNEFNNRIDAQRHILSSVNRHAWEKKELFGLSSKAIERWVSVNRIDSESPFVKLIITASSKLFFLANKSQEQISPEYQTASDEITAITSRIKSEINSLHENSNAAQNNHVMDKRS